MQFLFFANCGDPLGDERKNLHTSENRQAAFHGKASQSPSRHIYGLGIFYYV